MTDINYLYVYGRIADALERIAKALEEKNEKFHLLGTQTGRITTTSPAFTEESR